MMKNRKKWMLCLLLAALSFLVCACHQNPEQQALYSRLFAHFEGFGYTCELRELEADTPVPIYKASAWKKLMLGEEELLVYFDDSNRADYLSEPIDENVYGHVTRFGLRFVLVYPGDDAGVLEALNAIENE